ncbi:N-acetyl-gamma-glutamyl-phosphate reductase [Methylomarinovum caldicuralii]|uniref:N-acetyl-gamma-glutamyl-phosphate reductase n=1 Tax=Methylomarinovum caldicuralii TaxID=438856 RepID=A0AAU9CIF5_9GAMM|nr:N-acetyl-gamma-glutamyl-phosphate reductase [Methylomarinovum caldicuralii]BCX82790.1 N-acetyl-gamma-glutamyl-phosphate reductase [Methylomarinovum caldicuralii]
MIKVAVVGGTGYTGVELMRILARHPQAELALVTSRGDAGRRVAEVYPNLRGVVDLTFQPPEPQLLDQADVIFFATPNGTAMQYAPALLERGRVVIDLAADFRLKDPQVWEQWYGQPHACPELLASAVYGLPEVNREKIKKARLIACPGCYPTAVQLGFLPLLHQHVIERTGLVADCKSGVSGAGRQAQVATLMAETGEGFKAYAVPGHRHLPEIRQGLQALTGKPVELTFVPHLTPMIRGIHATLYARLREEADLQALYERHYAREPFVEVLPAGSHPDTVDVRGANRCQIAVHRPGNGDVVVVLAVIDNLVKGAAGQAVQNMNLVFGLPETAGLELAGLYP